jgi:hypothetical protein
MTSVEKCIAEFAVIERLCADKHAYENGRRISGYQAIAWHCRQAIAALTTPAPPSSPARRAV